MPMKAFVMPAAMFALLRRLGIAVVLAGLALAAWPASSWAQQGLTRAQERDLRFYDSALILARRGAGPALRRAGGARVASTLPIWRLPTGAALRVLPELLLANLVRDVEPNRPVPQATHLDQGDPLLQYEWWIPVVGLDRAEPPGPGKPVTVIDSGVDLTHEEFAARPATTPLNAQTTSGEAETHGTAVASVVGAPANGQFLVGVYPQAALQAWDASPSGNGITTADVVAGLDAAIRHGPGVVNLSLGTQFRSRTLESIVARTAGSNELIVASAGNGRTTGNPLEYPASFPHVLTVGAIDESRRPAVFSSGSPYVDLAAPGTNIVVAVTHSFSTSGYSLFSGTSFASPMVAGASAWVWTARPTLDVMQLAGVMRASAQDISTPGFDSFSGFGRLDIPTALSVAPPAPDPQEPNEDVTYVKPHGLLGRAARPLTAAGRPKGTVTARLEFAEDPRDVYRIWIPARRAAAVTLQPADGDVDLGVWGPQTVTVLEGGRARRRDSRGLSERRGRGRESLRVTNKGKRGTYYYVEASPGAGSGTARRVQGIGYSLSVATVKPKRARR
jgi:Subtilase family